MIAIITEKQAIAKHIALALNIDITVNGNGEYFQGRGFVIAWTSGELVSLSAVGDFGNRHLPKDNLPCIPDTFTLSVRKKQVKKGELEDKTALRKLNIIQNVFDT
jgi:DNA topoisomerase IA